MPPIIVPEGYAEVGIDFLRTGGTHLHTITFGVKLKAAPTPTGIQTDVKNAWTAASSMVFGQVTSMVAQTVHYKALWGGVPLSGTAPAAWAAAGGGPTLLPPNCSLVARKHTGIAGRKYRGRMNLPWAAESEVDANGIVLAATITNWVAPLANFLTQLEAAGRAQVNGMYLLHSDGTPPTKVLSMSIRNTVGTVRKRLPIT